MKPYPAYKPSGEQWMGEVPAHWEVLPLKQSFKIIGGSTPKSDNESFWDGDILWATPSDLSKRESVYISDTQRKITADGLASCGATLVPAASIVLSTRAPIGSLAIAEMALCTNQGCKSLVPSERANTEYFAHLLSISSAELNIRGKGTTFLELSGDALGSFKTPVPPITEQTQIAAYLDRETARVDTLIAEKGRLIETLREYRQATISEVVTQGLDSAAPKKPSGVPWLGGVPASWSVLRVKEVATVLPSNIDKLTVEGEQPVSLCNYVDVYKNDKITADIEFMPATATDEQIRKLSLTKGDVVLTKDSESPWDIAVPTYIAEDIPNLACGYHLAKLAPNEYLIRGDFLCWSLKAFPVSVHFSLAASGITRYGLSIANISDGNIPVPSLTEQQAIASYLDTETTRIDKLLAHVQDEIKLLQELRAATITDAVTGKIQVG